MTAREFILSRFRGARARRAGGVSTRVIYGGTHSFSLAALDEELSKMRADGVLGFAQGLWFLRGGGSPRSSDRSRSPEGPRRSTEGPEAREPVR